MTRLSAMMIALISNIALSAPGLAQAFRDGVYDGREIPGWNYSQAGMDVSGLPTWTPQVGAVDGANCNLDVTPLEAELDDWLAYFYQVTPDSFGTQLRQSGMDWQAGYLTEIISLQGRPAMRNLFLAVSEGQLFEVMRVSISGQSALVTLTCTTAQGNLLPRLQDFYGFANGIALLNAPAQ